ncbi:UDP-N-acetyl-D-glucosamine 6-dehydrogenase [Streptomyces lavendulae subsp. lavendulae]|uniref:UDP-N-acetyl-D-glucosamine 6-dehydrogenase n=1 Tax=Streptomyces lavendulae subsp. lavendulae TaxID=58340 RepID=A0A2K8P5B4_STRLA|nr:nucleotide sugar dehydrogenase [Streptomyces lavendulae]ATZ21944.1 UDP-N-acetyl-D-glucosamine 6-dehydrogenase [Streptomyces lavendulae subsp. lavendulae]ATZ29627.1 UDP-N-acetyl-D-glucosamine 6-dehydrogenase [Streptomyces lavendulae subsp. lavendulae]
MQIVVAGQGYVGLPLAVRAAQAGHHVVGYDVDPDRIRRLTAGDSYVEDVPSSLLRAVLDTGAYAATADAAALAGFDLAVITVPTPLRDGVPDLSHIEACAQTLGEHLRPGATVVLESTTYPGTTEELLVPTLEKASGLKGGSDFSVGFSPERIAPGSKRWSFEGTPKVVSGIDATSLEVIKAFYDTTFDTTVPVSAPRIAELAKLIENTFRLVNISMINELATLTERLGVNIWEAIDAAGTKPFGFTRFTPGPGVGGHCLPVDPLFLAWKIREELGVPFRFVELAADVNRRMPDYVVQRIVEALEARGVAVGGARVLLLGLTYKINATDLRNSPSARVAELLTSLGADVRGAEPNIPDGADTGAVRRVDATPEEVAAADTVVLLMDHARFDLPMIQQHAAWVLDCRNRMAGANVEVL